MTQQIKQLDSHFEVLLTQTGAVSIAAVATTTQSRIFSDEDARDSLSLFHGELIHHHYFFVILSFYRHFSTSLSHNFVRFGKRDCIMKYTRNEAKVFREVESYRD